MRNNFGPRVNFWIDHWEDLISNFLDKSYGLTLYSPHSLIEDIIIEIEDNGFDKSENKKYFRNKLGEYYKEDKVIKDSFSTEFNILITILPTDRISYISEQSKLIFEKFSKGLYFDTALKQLISLLDSPDPIDKSFISSISNLTNNIIVEFIKKGYDLKDIERFPNNLFDTYQYENEENSTFLHTKFPHSQDKKSFNYKNGKTNWNKYAKAIKEEIDKLSIISRIKYLSNYYYKKKETVRYIFAIHGITGNGIWEFDDITLYSLNKKRFIIDDEEAIHENLHRYNEDQTKYPNLLQVVTEAQYLLPKSSLKLALTAINSKIDLLTYFYNTKTPIEVDSSKFIIEKDGELLYTSHARRKDDYDEKIYHSIELEKIKSHTTELNKYLFLFEKSSFANKAVSQILNAIHWFSKAENTSKDEDKLLNYWISLETLFNTQIDVTKDILEKNMPKVNLIQEIISSNYIFVFLYKYGWDLHSHYRILGKPESPIFNRLGIPTALLKEADLCVSIGQPIYLKKFVKNVKKIQEYEPNQFYKNQIEEIHSFYHDAKYRLEALRSQINTIKEDITMIYRFRNLIVHNAHFNNTLLPYYIWKIKRYAEELIRTLSTMVSEEQLELHQMLIRIYQKKEEFLKKTEVNAVDLFRSEE
ncbi:hypothetical protein [Niabella hirudinis]|uniref:hypothetical protein n=1 Tax=Niabella hirudinis TaxID=1285929 RepID=UPI003EBEFF05